MGVGISYMGTKRELAATVSDVIATCKPGPVLDVFSGMCSVGEAVGQARQVWTNDVQVFAYEVARALFTSQEHPPGSQATADRLHDGFAAAFKQLSSHYEPALIAESALLESPTFDEFEERRGKLSETLRSCQERRHERGFHLFARQYSDTFIGVRQALEIDAVICSLKQHSAERTSSDCVRWLTIALGRTMLRVSNSTGHFAQYLRPKASNYRAFQRQRRRQVWGELLGSVDELAPVGEPRWRRGNKAFNQDTLVLLPRLIAERQAPSVIYADPPYTNDQYSRYYHLLETLVLYDYPSMSGKGLYRPDRFSTRFSLKAQSAAAMNDLVFASFQLGADVVLSYPSNGLVHSAGVDPLDILRQHYKDVEVCHAIGHDHSTFGASKGPAKSTVVEMIYRGRS